jgi:hypothetical protein
VDQEIHLGWQHIQSWTERVFTKERIADIVLLLFTLALWAVLLFYLHRAFENRTIVDISPYLSSLNSELSVPGY